MPVCVCVCVLRLSFFALALRFQEHKDRQFRLSLSCTVNNRSPVMEERGWGGGF